MYKTHPMVFEGFGWPWSSNLSLSAGTNLPPFKRDKAFTRASTSSNGLDSNKLHKLCGDRPWATALHPQANGARQIPQYANFFFSRSCILSDKTLWKRSRIATGLQNERRLLVHGAIKKVSDHPCIENDSHINSMSQTCSRRASQ